MVKINIQGYEIEGTIDEILEVVRRKEENKAVCAVFQQGRLNKIGFVGNTQEMWTEKRKVGRPKGIHTPIKKRLGRPKGSKTKKIDGRVKRFKAIQKTAVKLQKQHKNWSHKKAMKVASKMYDK